ncbi:TonB family protein [Novosphingobium resinovorum]|uniref:TonB family protein n=1 Tax=Novosphingobium resinovorum TaxID=158500 RepID=UPI002ECFDDE1|nr:TonB family protein [Novosphingobium resinovorum]
MKRLATMSAHSPSHGEGAAQAPASVAAPEPVIQWDRSSRYSDQPMSAGTRFLGLGGASAIILLILCGALFTWRSYAVSQAPATLSMFDVAPPAAPPEPIREVPPGPAKMQKEKQQLDPDQPKVELPRVEVPSLASLPVVANKPTPDPGPLIKETTAPESKPAPYAPQVSTGKPTWEGLVLGALNKVKRYPRDAHFARQQGVSYIRFIMNREGKVLSVRIERSSGFRSLDQEALSLPKRAQPLPKPPEDVKGDTIELVVPVEFFMR